MDLQTLIVAAVVAAAAYYVVRALRPKKQKQAGCASCPSNRNRADDYA